jgi:hypothetical protein
MPARLNRHAPRQADECLVLFEDWLKELPSPQQQQQQPVLFNSGVRAYLGPPHWCIFASEWLDAAGTRRQVALAWSHPHGAWLQWLGGNPAFAAN